MSTNGRSIHLIATSDEKRQAIWLHVFGAVELPIVGDKPRWQVMQGRPFDVLAYDLALNHLTEAQRTRFAGYLSRKYRLNYTETLAELNGRISWPIAAGIDIQVLEPAEQPTPLASLLSGQLLAAVGKRPLAPALQLAW